VHFVCTASNKDISFSQNRNLQKLRYTNKLKQLCVDFIAVCVFLTQHLLSVNIFELFDYDALNDRPDKIADFIRSILSDTSYLGRRSLVRTGLEWVNKNPLEQISLCIICHQKIASIAQGKCMGCGAEFSKEEAELIESFETIVEEYSKLKNGEKI
jgi:hypothetical protein